ncbi:MAG: dihydrolipoyl dehydrogenase [Microvirga sp.]
MADYDFDVLVIGAGPGGYVAAIRAAQLGLKTACAESRDTLGGTCLNVGCIPSKALLHASELFEEAAYGTLAKWGVKTSGVEVDLDAMHGSRQEAVKGLTQGIEFLFKKNKVEWLKGHATFETADTVKVGDRTVRAKNIVIATGSSVTPLPGIEIDQERIVDSTGALELPQVPKRMVVIGGGVIGLELGSVWRRLGAEVVVVEFLDRVLPGMDLEIGRQFQRILAKQGMQFRLSSKVTKVERTKSGAKATIEPAAGGEAEIVDADVVLVSVGRVPYTEGLGLEAIGVQRDAKGRILTDAHFATNVTGIYAIGDVIAGPMLAHKAEDEGVAIAEILAGKAGHVNYDVIPNVVYTDPEVASLGKTEEELKEAGIAYNVGKFPFTANGRAKVNRTTDGFVKILADKTTDRVLGVHIMGPDAGNLIMECGIAMEFGASSEDIARSCHPHPTLTEAVKEAALAVEKRAIHM